MWRCIPIVGQYDNLLRRNWQTMEARSMKPGEPHCGNRKNQLPPGAPERRASAVQHPAADVVTPVVIGKNRASHGLPERRAPAPHSPTEDDVAPVAIAPSPTLDVHDICQTADSPIERVGGESNQVPNRDHRFSQCVHLRGDSDRSNSTESEGPLRRMGELSGQWTEYQLGDPPTHFVGEPDNSQKQAIEAWRNESVPEIHVSLWPFVKNRALMEAGTMARNTAHVFSPRRGGLVSQGKYRAPSLNRHAEN